MKNERFSQRKGIKPVKSEIQVDSMDSDLRNRLWNVLTVFYWKRVDNRRPSSYEDIQPLVEELWHDYFKRPIDTLSDNWYNTYEEIRGYFFKAVWNEVYDFIEFIANNYSDKYDEVNLKFMNLCNSILERELSAYRFIGGKIIQITSEVEISEIEEALEITQSFKAVNTHLKRASGLLSDRKSPDYRNSIKESISAVEAICKLITEEKGATLGQALKKIEDRIGLHPALEKAFSKLYEYTSDAEGIRHALLDEPNLSFEDAKFMLVSCSAFTNYLINKASKAGINITCTAD